jgi:hypothetical protein
MPFDGRQGMNNRFSIADIYLPAALVGSFWPKLAFTPIAMQKPLSARKFRRSMFGAGSTYTDLFCDAELVGTKLHR